MSECVLKSNFRRQPHLYVEAVQNVCNSKYSSEFQRRAFIYDDNQ